ncbi:YgaP-like transmembrane domain [Pseudonocardia sp. NPDC049635]|uniref:YgaP-like transmembrane domain n=1 Tax=Pseudonocardia sp. NPDC049635 TaxID=3155506 RepID=UPI0033FC4E0A
MRAEQGRRHLAAAGLDTARVLDGGVPAYAAAGGDVVHGRTVWAMERQVRLVAGSLVLTGILGGRFVSPKLRLLAGGIGTGLTFSALSDTCAMAGLLAKLPFNRGVVEPDPAAVIDRVRRRRPGPVRVGASRAGPPPGRGRSSDRGPVP